METFKTQILREDFDLELSNLMVKFLTDLDYDMLSEEKQLQYDEIIDLLNEEEGLDADDPEEVYASEAKLKRRIKKSDKQKRKRDYRKNKGKLKRAAKKRRKTSAFKKTKKKAKRMAKRGRTSTGKRQSTLI